MTVFQLTSVRLMRSVQAVRRQGEDAGEGAGADGDQQEESGPEAASSRG